MIIEEAIPEQKSRWSSGVIPYAQMGYWIGDKYWNMGIATESINLVIHHAFHVLRLHKVYANVLATNRASIRAEL